LRHHAARRRCEASPAACQGDRSKTMKQIARDVYEAIQRSHPIEAMIWARWLRTGEARIVGITEA